ncbi:MAG: HAD-IIA family hydrolase [Erysipelotrichaceae bacterium]|nr:HAD-IIA family hydrolase [Erysipelotrichaceae bacterium]
MKKLLLDLDGTMYHGTRRIESAVQFLNELNQRGIDYLFLTNNAARTQTQAANHMSMMGYEKIEPMQFYTSAMAAVDYAASHYTQRRAFVIGEEGIREALIQNGFEIVTENADFVFVGLDRNAYYKDYSLAIRQILNGAILIGTNDDRILPSEEGANVGNGSIVHMMEYCTQTQSLKIGKPSSVILEGALKYTGWKKEDVLIVGDNLETDILCGIHSKIQTALVLTGLSHRKDIEKTGIVPDLVAEDLLELLHILEQLDNKEGM